MKPFHRFSYNGGLFSPSKKVGWIVLPVALITILGISLRLYAAPRMSIDVDERVYFQAALKYADYIRAGDLHMLVWYNFNSEHPPLFKILYGLALLAQPRLEHFSPQEFIDGMAMYKVIYSPWGLTDRYVSVFFGGLTILALALINPVAGLFYAIDTLAVQFNSTMFLESLPVLTSFLSALCYLRWRQRIDRAACPSAREQAWLALSGAFLGISAASKYTYAVVGIAILIHFTGDALEKRRPRDLWLLAAWGGLALLAFFALDPYLWRHPIERLLGTLTFHVNHTRSDGVKNANLPFFQPLIWFSAPFYKFSGNAYAIFPIKLDTMIGVLALAGLPRLFARQRLYFIWLVAGMVTLFLWPTKWAQYSMIVMVPLCVSASMGAGGLWDLLKRGFTSWLDHHQKARHSRRSLAHGGR